MAAIKGLGLTFSAATVTYSAGAINEDVRVDAGTEAITLAGANDFRKSLLVADLGTGAVTEVAGTDADALEDAEYPAVPANKVVLCGVELDDTAITDLDLTVQGNETAASA